MTPIRAFDCYHYNEKTRRVTSLRSESTASYARKRVHRREEHLTLRSQRFFGLFSSDLSEIGGVEGSPQRAPRAEVCDQVPGGFGNPPYACAQRVQWIAALRERLTLRSQRFFTAESAEVCDQVPGGFGNPPYACAQRVQAIFALESVSRKSHFLPQTLRATNTNCVIRYPGGFGNPCVLRLRATSYFSLTSNHYYEPT
jgi:hypothetical protein